MSDAPVITPEPAGQTSADGSTPPAAPATSATPPAAPVVPEVRDPAALLSAYEAEKGKRREQDAELRRIRDEFESFKAKAEGKEKEYEVAQERLRVQAEADAKANEKILKAEVRAAATGKLSDPADALRFLDLSGIEVGVNGEYDSTAVANLIDDLIKSKPYLAAQGGQRFQGAADGGARNDATKPPQLNKVDLERMSREGKYDEITAAKAAGQFNTLLGIKP